MDYQDIVDWSAEKILNRFPEILHFVSIEDKELLSEESVIANNPEIHLVNHLMVKNECLLGYIINDGKGLSLSPELLSEIKNIKTIEDAKEFLIKRNYRVFIQQISLFGVSEKYSTELWHIPSKWKYLSQEFLVDYKQTYYPIWNIIHPFIYSVKNEELPLLFSCTLLRMAFLMKYRKHNNNSILMYETESEVDKAYGKFKLGSAENKAFYNFYSL